MPQAPPGAASRFARPGLARSRWPRAPARLGGGSQRHADRGVTSRREGPIEHRTQIVHRRNVVCEPFVGWPGRRMGLGTYEKVAVKFRMAPRLLVAFAAFLEPFERIRARRVEQPVARGGVFAPRHNKRFCD